MKIVINKNVKKSIPEVGQFWSLAGSRDAFIRIDDYRGVACFPQLSPKTHIFGVDINNGSMCYCSRDADIVILEPTNDTLVFNVVN